MLWLSDGARTGNIFLEDYRENLKKRFGIIYNMTEEAKLTIMRLEGYGGTKPNWKVPVLFLCDQPFLFPQCMCAVCALRCQV